MEQSVFLLRWPCGRYAYICRRHEYLIRRNIWFQVVLRRNWRSTEFNTITFYCILGIISNSDGLCFCGVVSGPENVSYFIVIFNLLYIHVLSRKVDRKSKIPIVMALMKKLTWCSVVNNFYINAKHIPGKYNNIAYAISRFKMKKFRNLAPNAKQEPTLCVTFQQLTLI